MSVKNKKRPPTRRTYR